jgi:hypothetical protein
MPFTLGEDRPAQGSPPAYASGDGGAGGHPRTCPAKLTTPTAVAPPSRVTQPHLFGLRRSGTLNSIEASRSRRSESRQSHTSSRSGARAEAIPGGVLPELRRAAFRKGRGGIPRCVRGKAAALTGGRRRSARAMRFSNSDSCAAAFCRLCPLILASRSSAEGGTGSLPLAGSVRPGIEWLVEALTHVGEVVGQPFWVGRRGGFSAAMARRRTSDCARSNR